MAAPTTGEFHHGLLAVRQLEPGCSVRAVCADVLWRLPEATRFFDANLDAARRGVAITRVFVLPEGETPLELERCMRLHHEAGAEVLVLRRESFLFEELPELFLPPGVGFACLTRGESTEVRVHFSETEDEAFGKLYTDREREVVDSFIKWFEELSAVAEPYASHYRDGSPGSVCRGVSRHPVWARLVTRREGGELGCGYSGGT